MNKEKENEHKKKGSWLGSEESKKPVVKFFLTRNPPRLNNLWLKNSIGRPVLKVLGDAGQVEKAKEFKKEYELRLYDTKWVSGGRHGESEVQVPFYYGEFFELASKFVKVEMYRDFKQYAEDYDEDLRRQDSWLTELDL